MTDDDAFRDATRSRKTGRPPLRKKGAYTAAERQRRHRKKLKAEKQRLNVKSIRRAERERDLAAKIEALPQKLYGVIYADPPWRFKPYSRDTGMSRAAENHYPTMALAEIEALPIPAAEDCVLFLWATVPMLPQALDVMRAWGFEYRSHAIWAKDQIGTGYWVRNRHELLLIGTRGDIPAPAPGDQPESLISALREEHSAKPAIFAQIIETMFPHVPKLEMFARGTPRAGWDAWGNEVG
jgi:N6-adenosine-specific RNA methylase IME4